MKEKKDKHFIGKPVYPGGRSAMRQFIQKHMQYPAEALKDGVEGTVTVKYTIDYSGKVIEAHVVSGIGSGCDEEAVRLAKLLKFDVPKVRKLRVQFHKEIHIHFRLPQQKPNRKVSYQYQVSREKTQGSRSKTSGGYQYTITIGKPEKS